MDLHFAAIDTGEIVGALFAVQIGGIRSRALVSRKAQSRADQDSTLEWKLRQPERKKLNISGKDWQRSVHVFIPFIVT